MLPEHIRVCPRCGKHYEFVTMTVANQRWCPKCRIQIAKEIDETSGNETLQHEYYRHSGGLADWFTPIEKVRR